MQIQGFERFFVIGRSCIVRVGEELGPGTIKLFKRRISTLSSCQVPNAWDAGFAVYRLHRMTLNERYRSTKADKIEVSYTNEAAPEVKSIKAVSIVSPTTEPTQLSKKKMERIVIRHWHDPFDKRSVPAAQPPSKRKASNLNRSPTVPRVPKS